MISNNSNTGIGYQALMRTQGNFNTALGREAGEYVDGNNNVLLGYQAGSAATTITRSGSVMIGYQAGYGSTGNNKIFIENSSAGANNALIYGEFDNNILRTNSEFQIGNPSGTGYAFPTTDGSNG
ncbi:hypothetical protein ATE92_1357 [Ulvibacter sp. MAR_2010_11]|uniref:hypothetical protein n=1 Tax=Ulvibacter sp. MAR_2010_11 TaxID=1250229 RepID=UPI000C2B5B85|nr:hypothetical protein [Ulvibacter sp. MAR_2010_11]PKA83208.1 hypothetical protein ATE92_1357 [Ulvibacter sp. MAR_2010_11]